MGLRVCLVTPFAWSRPHDVNEHVAGVARELRLLGHHVTVLAPSTRASDLIEGRRALLEGDGAEVGRDGCVEVVRDTTDGSISIGGACAVGIRGELQLD